MAGADEVSAVRSDPKGWTGWLAMTCVVLLAFLLAGLLDLAYGWSVVFPWIWLAAACVAGLVIPAWAVYRLDPGEG